MSLSILNFLLVNVKISFILPEAILLSKASYRTGKSPSRTPLVLSDLSAGLASMSPMVHGRP